MRLNVQQISSSGAYNGNLTRTHGNGGGVSRSSPQISTKGRILLHLVPRFVGERDGGGEPGHYSCLSVHLARAGQLPREKEKPSLLFFQPPLFSAFCSLSFFYFGGRLAGLSMAHICSSSLLVFSTASGPPPPRPAGGERESEGGEGWLKVKFMKRTGNQTNTLVLPTSAFWRFFIRAQTK